MISVTFRTYVAAVKKSLTKICNQNVKIFIQ